MASDTIKSLFEKEFEAEHNAVFRFCLFRVSGRDQALDLTQETFLRLWQTLEQGKTIINFRSFLFTVARRLIIDWYRKKKSFSLDRLTEESQSEPADPGTFSHNLELGAEGRYLMEHIEKIHPSYRQAVYLRYVEDLSPPEIGEVLGVSANAASVRINRGLEELRQVTGYSPEAEEKTTNDG